MAQTPQSPEFLSREAYLMDSRQQTPESQPTEAQQTGESQKGFQSWSESMILPRASLFDRPPTPPPKDPPKDTQLRTPTVPVEGTKQTNESSGPGESKRILQGDKVQQQAVSKPVDVDLRQSTAIWGKNKIATTGSTLGGKEKGGKQIPTFRIHPLAMSPPSPAPSAVTKMPRRPARPASLRLSSFSSRIGLTMDNIVRVDTSRPGTSRSQVSKLHTGVTNTTRGTRIKHGHGKYATTELVPQPSDDPEDPLNWQTWKKELNFYSILMTVAMVNVMKTTLISGNAELVSQLSCSYRAAVALTGVPLMLSATTGVAALTVSKTWGRRPVYLASMVSIFIGLVWNSQISSSYGQFMAARSFQGLGWGAFDSLMLGTILDTYFQHECPTKMGTYCIVSVATLWGAPLLSGLTAQRQQGVALQFEILAVFQVVSIPLLLFGAPETMYDRLTATGEKTTPGWSPRTGWSSLGLQSGSRYGRFPAWARGRGLDVDRVIRYIKEVARPQSYYAPGTQDGLLDTALMKQTLRAFVAPTTLLAFLASFLPHSLLWGLSFSLSGLFARPPFQLFPATVGSLLATTLILTTLVVAIFSLWPAWSKTLSAFQTPYTHLLVLGVGAFLSFIGLLGFGLYVGAHVNSNIPQADANYTSDFRFAALSFILGLLAAGAYTLEAPTMPLINRSTQFTSPNLSAIIRNIADMEAGVVFWRTLFAGIFVMGVPAATVTSTAGLRSTGIGVAVVQVFVVAGVGAVWYLFQEDVWRWDGRILGCVDLQSLKEAKSYFELG